MCDTILFCLELIVSFSIIVYGTTIGEKIYMVFGSIVVIMTLARPATKNRFVHLFAEWKARRQLYSPV